MLWVVAEEPRRHVPSEDGSVCTVKDGISAVMDTSCTRRRVASSCRHAEGDDSLKGMSGSTWLT